MDIKVIEKAIEDMLDTNKIMTLIDQALSEAKNQGAREVLEIDLKQLVKECLKLETHYWNSYAEDSADRVLRYLRHRAGIK